MDALKYTTQQSNDRGLQYTTIECGGAIMSFGGWEKNESFTFLSPLGIEIASHSGIDWGLMGGYMSSSKIDGLLCIYEEVRNVYG